jgi:hypothetical protein
MAGGFMSIKVEENKIIVEVDANSGVIIEFENKQQLAQLIAALQAMHDKMEQ